MSDLKHTPGPWSAFYKSKYDEWHVSLPVPGRGMKLALAPDGIQSGNREADARLIAAAPDLLDELIKARAELESYELEATGEGYNNPALNAAISKATGEA